MLSKNLTKECARSSVLRSFEELCWRSRFNDFALVHENDAVGDSPREIHFMRDADHRVEFF